MEKEIYEKIKENVYQLLNETEAKYGFKIIFAGETGSRSYGLETENSDVDVKGFFIYSEDQYLGVQKRISYIKLNHETKINQNVDVDLELIDLRKYLRDRCKNIILDESVIWLLTEKTYIDKIPKDLKILLMESIQPPVFQIWSKISKYQQKFIKSQSEDGLIIGKDVLNSIVQSFQVLFIKEQNQIINVQLDFKKSYEKLKELLIKKQSLQDQIKMKDEYKILIDEIDKMYSLAQWLFDLKKKDNKSKLHIDNENLKQFFHFIQNYILKEQPIERKDFDHRKISNQIFRQFVHELNIIK